jgi:hypothetical protein
MTPASGISETGHIGRRIRQGTSDEVGIQVSLSRKVYPRDASAHLPAIASQKSSRKKFKRPELVQEFECLSNNCVKQSAQYTLHIPAMGPR